MCKFWREGSDDNGQLFEYCRKVNMETSCVGDLKLCSFRNYKTPNECRRKCSQENLFAKLELEGALKEGAK